MAAHLLVCLSKSKSLSGSGSVSKSNFICGSSLKKLFFSFLYPCTFLWRKEKYQKKHCPCSLAFGYPRANAFFSRGQELARRWRAQTACPLFPKKSFALGCAAMGRAEPEMHNLGIADHHAARPGYAIF
ncbi:MAG: hypothetical protein ACOZBW_04925, partial [Thermodesulfobacteriota bacterium]